MKSTSASTGPEVIGATTVSFFIQPRRIEIAIVELRLPIASLRTMDDVRARLNDRSEHRIELPRRRTQTRCEILHLPLREQENGRETSAERRSEGRDQFHREPRGAKSHRQRRRCVRDQKNGSIRAVRAEDLDCVTAEPLDRTRSLGIRRKWLNGSRCASSPPRSACFTFSPLRSATFYPDSDRDGISG